MFKAKPLAVSLVESHIATPAAETHPPGADRRREWIAWKAEYGQQSLVCRVTERPRHSFSIAVIENGVERHRQGVEELRPVDAGRLDAVTDRLQARFLEPFIAGCLVPFAQAARTGALERFSVRRH